jgi:hypothetical protein
LKIETVIFTEINASPLENCLLLFEVWHLWIAFGEELAVLLWNRGIRELIKKPLGFIDPIDGLLHRYLGVEILV